MDPIRVVFEQPAFPVYRAATYRLIAQTPGVDFRLVVGVNPNLKSAQALDFPVTAANPREVTLAGQIVYWQPAQLALATRRQCDVLLLTWNVRYLSLIPALIRARLAGVKTILFGHGFARTDRDLFSPLRRLVARLATCTCVYNHTARNNLIAQGLDPSKVFVALNSIDQTAIRQQRTAWLSDPDRLRNFQTQHRLTGNANLLFLSRLIPKARVDQLVRAMHVVRHVIPHARLTLVGGGDASTYQAIVRELGLEQTVTFTGEIYAEDQLAPYFLSSHAFAYPGEIGLSLIHAFSYGLPVITNDHIATHGPEIEALHDGVNGLLFRNNDVEALAQAIVTLLQDPTRRQAMCEAALKVATDEFSLANCVRGYLNAIGYCAGRQLELPQEAEPARPINGS